MQRVFSFFPFVFKSLLDKTNKTREWRYSNILCMYPQNVSEMRWHYNSALGFWLLFHLLWFLEWLPVVLLILACTKVALLPPLSLARSSRLLKFGKSPISSIIKLFHFIIINDMLVTGTFQLMRLENCNHHTWIFVSIVGF